ncbi:hypothetical protein AAW00_05130 [Aurantiacibacter luteus]|uniref:Uncharacterized protein n=1 Tax=Aurantiacibacter luteus TaxID=1581420 RepID=A0A0G9MYB4_9SPHN|nr:hypothetical protein AAW00_05130 [Aurantiacibacter luteus]
MKASDKICTVADIFEVFEIPQAWLDIMPASFLFQPAISAQRKPVRSKRLRAKLLYPLWDADFFQAEHLVRFGD